MEKGHSRSIDPRPKRRKDKDNPYRLFTAGAATSEPHYFIQFKDGAGIEHCLEIEKPLYDLFDQFELDDLSYMNEVDRHCEKEEQTEASINRRAVVRQETPEMAVLRQLESKELHSAILKLPEIQRRRLILYYYGELDGDQISVIEGCSKSAVSQTLSIALKNLKKFLD